MPAGGFLQMDNFTFVGKVIMALSELIYDETIKAPDFNTFHTVFPGIVAQEEIGFIGKGGLVGVAGQSCNPTCQPWNIKTRKIVWDPKRWELLLCQCWTDLESTAAIYSLHTGVNIPDFTDTDYMNIIVKCLNDAMLDFWWRLFWFSDTAAKNVADGGTITNGIDTDYFTILDGFWKQIFAQASAVPTQRPAIITENTGATYAAQELDPDNVIGYLTNLVYKAPLLLRRQTDANILVTQSVYDAYEQALTNKCCLESNMTALENGRTALRFKGYNIVAMPQWDAMIAEYEDTGAKLNNPHRMLFIPKSVLGVGLDNANSFDNFRIWYDPNTRMVKIEGMGRADAKLLNPELFTLGI